MRVHHSMAYFADYQKKKKPYINVRGPRNTRTLNFCVAIFSYSLMGKPEIIFKGSMIMNNLFRRFTKRRCELIIREDDMVKVISVLAQYRLNLYKFGIGNCGWAAEKDRWYVNFIVTEPRFHSIVTTLKEMGVTSIKTTAKDSFGNTYYEEL